MSELNERYNSCRAKTADCVAAAVKRKEDVSHPFCGYKPVTVLSVWMLTQVVQIITAAYSDL